MMFGNNGYPVRVRNTNYYAISVTDNSYRTKQNPKFLYLMQKFLAKYKIPDFHSPQYTKEVIEKVSAFRRKLQRRYPYSVVESNWIFTDIYHAGNDPLFSFRTRENSPWLTDRMIVDINTPSTARYRERAITATSSDEYFTIADERKSLALQRESLYKKVYEGDLLVEEKYGGYISLEYSEPHMFSELVSARKNRDYSRSDEIKNQNSHLEFQFTQTGIYWFKV